jgi:SPOR domain
MLRIIFLLLVLGNLAFFAWDRYLRAPLDPQAHIQQVQITPEKIRLAAPTPTATPRPPAAAPIAAADIKAAGACLEWGTFIGPEAARGDTAIAELALPPAQVKRVSSDLVGYWVMMPALKSRADATKATEDLKALGVNDYSIVTDAPWRNAISLGVFRTEEAAQTLLAALRKKGVTDAVMEKRDAFFRQVVFYVREPTDATVAKLTALRVANAGTEIKAVRCPAP